MTLTSDCFQRIYDPSAGNAEEWYINDHCFVKDRSGLWHMFGITHQEPANPLAETFFAHATSQKLLAQQWDRQPPVIHAQYERWNETLVWAPHIIKHEDGYYMFYCAGGDDHSKYKIHLATSDDLWNWQRHEANPMVVDGFDARDPMVLAHEDGWIMYYTANSTPAGGQHVVAAVTSKDLVSWGDKREAFVHPKSGTYGGPTESPYVVRKNGKYYLFVCTNDPYNTSAVYESETPYAWDIARAVGSFPSHASEVIHDPATGKYYISRAGWGEKGLHLAELNWRES